MLGRRCDTQRPKAVEEHETRGKMGSCRYSYAAWLLLLCGGLPGLLQGPRPSPDCVLLPRFWSRFFPRRHVDESFCLLGAAHDMSATL
jgi:hypothetical protein